MAQQRVLIAYGTGYGQTAKIARRIGEVLSNAGIAPTLVNLGEQPSGAIPSAFDGVIVGASVLSRHHQRSVQGFVTANHDVLNALPSAFFSVSGSAGSTRDSDHAALGKIVATFLQRTRWRPGLVEPIAGAMAFTKYNPFLRWFMKRISAREGGPTDTSRDHELPDWAQVERFATTFGSKVQQQSQSQELVGARQTAAEHADELRPL